MVGLCIGNNRSTPTPAETFRTVKFSLMPPPRLAITRPSKAWSRSLSPSRTRTMTRTVSPGSNAGMSVRKPSRATSANRSIVESSAPSGAWCLQVTLMYTACRRAVQAVEPHRPGEAHRLRPCPSGARTLPARLGPFIRHVLLPQIRPPFPGEPLGLRPAPRLDPCVVARAEDVRHREPPIFRRPGVARRAQEPIVVRIAARALVVAEGAGEQPHHRVEDAHCRRLPAREDEV